MTRLPDGWIEVPIGSLCSLENGRSFKPTDWSDKGLPIVRIQNLNNENAPYNHFNGDVEERHRLRGGELLFAWSGTPGTSFGAHLWRGTDAVLNQHIFRVDFNESLIDKRFFRFAINQKLNELSRISHGGVGLRHVTKGKFEATEIVLPPLEEQRRIAAKLELLLARVSNCRERLARVRMILDAFVRAAVSSGISGALTPDRFGVGTRLSRQRVSLNDLCRVDRAITYGVVKLGKEIPGGVPCLRTSDVRWLRLDTSGVKRIDPALSRQHSRTVLSGNEVLVNIRGTLGGVAVTTDDTIGWNVSREVAVVPVDTTIADPHYVALCVASDQSQQWLNNAKKGIAYVGINLEDLKVLPVELPPLDEQKEIVRRTKSLFDYANQLRGRHAGAELQIERLSPAILGKAFRGQLTFQNPQDESAEKLLERINIGRAISTSNNVQRQRAGRTAIMSSKLTKELVKDVIQNLSDDTFSFDDIRTRTAADYESLRDIVFALLSERDPMIRQEFSVELRTMCFRRVGL